MPEHTPRHAPNSITAGVKKIIHYKNQGEQDFGVKLSAALVKTETS